MDRSPITIIPTNALNERLLQPSVIESVSPHHQPIVNQSNEAHFDLPPPSIIIPSQHSVEVIDSSVFPAPLSGSGYSSPSSSSASSTKSNRTPKLTEWEVPVYGKIFVLLATCDMLLLLTVSFLSIFADHSVDRDIRYTAIAGVIATVGFYFFAVDSILLENLFQFYASLVLHSLITLYVIFHYFVLSSNLGVLYHSMSLYVFVLVALFELSFIVLAYYIRQSFGWRYYKKIGGSITLRRLYKQSQIFLSLLKLDFCFGVLLLLLAAFYLFKDTYELTMNIIAMIITIGWAILGYVGLRKEHRLIMLLFFAFASLQPIYISLKLYAMLTDKDNSYPTSTFQQFYITAILAVLCRLMLMLWGVRVTKNFGQGLKDSAAIIKKVKKSSIIIQEQISDTNSANLSNGTGGTDVEGGHKSSKIRIIRRRSAHEDRVDEKSLENPLVSYAKPLCQIL